MNFLVSFVQVSRVFQLDELSRFLRSGDWKVGFDSTRIAIGEKAARKGLVREFVVDQLESGEVEFRALVSDGKGSFDEVTVGLWRQDGQMVLEGSCSCEFGVNCEHAVAMIAWVAKGDRLKAAFRPAHNLEGEGCTDWVDAMLAEDVGESELSSACLVYFLSAASEGAELKLLQGIHLKAGGLGRPLKKFVNEDRKAIDELAGEDDQILLEELWQRQMKGSFEWRVEGMAWELILKRLSITGRLLSGEESREPMKIGEPRNGYLDWEKDGLSRRPVVRTQPSSNFSLVAGGIWYVDQSRRELGRVIIDDKREKVKKWLKGPVLDAAGWQALKDELQGRGANLPGLRLGLGDSTQSGSPENRARLQLRVESAKGYLNEIHAQAKVVYPDHEFFLTAAENRRGYRIEGANGDMMVLARDVALESRGLQELRALGLEMGMDKRDPVWLPSSPGQDGDSMEFRKRYWQRFRFELVNLLEGRGWEVRFAPGVGHEPIVFRADSWKAEIVEEGGAWFHLSAGFEIDGQAFELQPLLTALIGGAFMELTEGLPDGQEFLFFLPDGQAIVLPVGRFRRLLNRLHGLLEFRWKPGQPLRVHKTELKLVLDDSLEVEGNEEAFDFAGRLSPVDGELLVPSVAAPRGLEATLREYQLSGYSWLQYLGQQGLNGILADDMGLGKTLQTLAHLLSEKESGRDQGLPSLIIAPTSVVYNWQREAMKFAPDLRVLVLQGGERRAKFDQIGDHDLVLSSFALLARDLEVLSDQKFHAFVLDEAQHIKNRQAQVSDAARSIISSQRLCLSGTPVENHLGELWALMDFLNPGLLGDQDSFQSHFRGPIEKNGDEARQGELNRLIGPLILRRTKSQVATELPPKTEISHEIEMTEGQKELYETVRSTMDEKVRRALAAAGGGQAQIMFLEALLKLRQICCHPQLLDQEHDHQSAKFEFFKTLVADLLSGGHRILVFSQFTSMLAMIENYLEEQGIAFLILTGETQDRQNLVERFQGGEADIFLISLKAGGTGLTLTGADTVIHYDPWWNPAAENQATDRAYRIGQQKAVMVHKLICKDTVEQKIQSMQNKKGELAAGVLAGSLEL